MEPARGPGAPSPGKRHKVQAEEPILSTPIQLPPQPTLAYGTPIMPYHFPPSAFNPTQASPILAEVLVRQLEQAEAKNKQLEESLSAQRLLLAASEREVESLRQDLEKEVAKVRLLEVSKAAPEAEGASESEDCADEDDGLFHFVLATTGQTGSFPRSYLESAPESLLCKMYSGNSTPPQQDKEGKALVHCHPDRWHDIIEHLATGAVPLDPNPQLLAQARFWKIKRLTTALEALTPGLQVTKRNSSTTAQCRFVALTKLVHNAENVDLTFPDPQNHLIQWMVQVDSDGVFLFATSTSEEALKSKEVTVNVKFKMCLREKAASFDVNQLFRINSGRGFGRRWPIEGYSFDQVVSEPLARAQDCLVLEVEIKRV